MRISISDVSDMTEILQALFLSRDCLDDFVVQAYLRAKAKLSRPEIWMQVEALASAQRQTRS